jgi:tetratricopeptide (TPR) repeat protein
MVKSLLVILLTLLFTSKLFACLNGESRALKNGTILFEEDVEKSVPYGHRFHIEEFANAIIKLDSLYKATKDLDYLSDKGLLLILLKEYNQAIAIYLEIEKIEPNRYSTASNIGTAYELLGENENALRWIKKSVEIDAKSHKGSEWIHIKILEAKLKGEQFITSDFLLNTNFGTEKLPKSSLTSWELANLSEELYYQLNERISFVKPKDKIVAQLLFDLANANFLLGNFDVAKNDYEMAKEYGFENNLIEERIRESERLIKLPKETSDKIIADRVKPNYLIYGLAMLLSIAALTIFFVYKRRKLKKN